MSSNGLRSSVFHIEDEASDDIAGLDNKKLSFMAPEEAAQKYLEERLEKKPVRSFLPSRESTTKRPTSWERIGNAHVLRLTNTQIVKFRQKYNDIPVYGSQVTVELDEQNELIAINSAIVEATDIDSSAKNKPEKTIEKIKPEKTIELVSRLIECDPQNLDVTSAPHYYFDSKEERWRLVYIVKYRFKNTEDLHKLKSVKKLVDYVFDAYTGDLVSELPRVKTPLKEFRDTGDLVSKLPRVKTPLKEFREK
ncbi:MAG: hypothetical protein F6J89_14375 [Symploca sp. SIO1C4]|uniref:FTP domain-containing protein n=1 Tax=Symploca sp. SIO1C4 TaxID=2607765 RepID=A0A6B3NGM0_9CYAN|nr:hypothetical protein [Symploca sp. SIO1C4]